jgi:hypothetical protein
MRRGEEILEYDRSLPGFSTLSRDRRTNASAIRPKTIT